MYSLEWVGEVGKKRQQKMWTNTCDLRDIFRGIQFIVSCFHGEGTF